jgi:hypothetical protein
MNLICLASPLTVNILSPIRSSSIEISPLGVFIFVPCKKHGRKIGVGGMGVGVVGIGCADALRAATTNDTPAPTIIFEAARKLRRDLISVIFLEDIVVDPSVYCSGPRVG